MRFPKLFCKVTKVGLQKKAQWNFKVDFSLYIGVVSLIIFLLQAFTITHLSDEDTEPSRGTLCFLWLPVLQLNNYPHFNNFIM